MSFDLARFSSSTHLPSKERRWVSLEYIGHASTATISPMRYASVHFQSLNRRRSHALCWLARRFLHRPIKERSRLAWRETDARQTTRPLGRQPAMTAARPTDRPTSRVSQRAKAKGHDTTWPSPPLSSNRPSH
ncbi:hypothetical protein LX32DRAFT_375745 [Colletotrichum zoysiae]|uniref:Uncharacterized protein n=1 Tax=Colletotrichum zoysiae TaxID=1216348 RepID=A0AAD9HHF0_9PEZI|nr:hypothetical protein LX32DRAFT_375745 [Colletotrichum zoysiae]